MLIRQQSGLPGRCAARRRSERGASLLEFALILPVFMMLVMGIFSGGRLYNQKLTLTHAAREGARYGATIPAEQTFASPPTGLGPGGSRTWAEGIRDVIVERSDGELENKHVVCVALVEGPRNSPSVVAPSPAGNTHIWRPFAVNPCPYREHATDTTNPGKRVQVAVERPGELDVFLFTMDVTLDATANAQFEGE